MKNNGLPDCLICGGEDAQCPHQLPNQPVKDPQVLDKYLTRMLAAQTAQVAAVNADSLEVARSNPLLNVSELSAEFTCPSCGGFPLHRVTMKLSGPYSGSVVGGSCEFRDSASSYLGKQMFIVEPLPDPVTPVYQDED